MSIVPASSKTIANRNMSEGKSKDSPECSEIKLISKPPIKICLGVNKNLLLQKNNKSVIQLKTNPPPNIHIEDLAKNKPSQRILQNDPVENPDRNQVKYDKVITYSADSSIESSKIDIGYKHIYKSSDGVTIPSTSNVEPDIEIIVDINKDHNQKICNQPASDKDHNYTKSTPPAVAKEQFVGEETVKSNQFHILLDHSIQNPIAMNSNIASSDIKNISECYEEVETIGQLYEYEDEDFPSPLRPISPQSQLRDLCKRGDAEQLEKFLNKLSDTDDHENLPETTEKFQKVKCTKKIDKDKVDLDASTEDGWTALHDIITHECQFTDVARVLLCYGANVNTQDIHGDSPLHSSLLYHNTDNIELLLKYSANVEATNASGRKPIHIANDAESLELLLDYGASVNSQDRIGNTPLHYAVVAKDVDRVQLLLDRGCDVDIPNNTGASPLHISNDLEIATKLLNATANPNASDQNGNIALHMAVKGRHKEWAKLLVSRNGNPNLSNNNGKTPFNLAKDKEMKNILLGIQADISAANSGDNVTAIRKVNKPKLNTVSVTGKMADSHSPLPYPPTTVISSPGILKRPIDKGSGDANGKPKGPRLRFSEHNDYSGVEDLLPSKRVKVRPIYLEPQFSSDED